MKKAKKVFTGRFCPFQRIEVAGEIKAQVCNEKCALYIEGFNKCVFFSITANLREITKVMDEHKAR